MRLVPGLWLLDGETWQQMPQNRIVTSSVIVIGSFHQLQTHVWSFVPLPPNMPISGKADCSSPVACPRLSLFLSLFCCLPPPLLFLAWGERAERSLHSYSIAGKLPDTGGECMTSVSDREVKLLSGQHSRHGLCLAKLGWPEGERSRSRVHDTLLRQTKAGPYGKKFNLYLSFFFRTFDRFKITVLI